MNAVAQSTDLRQPLLWSLAVHVAILLAIGLSTFAAPAVAPAPKILTIALHHQAHQQIAPTSAVAKSMPTPIKPVITPKQPTKQPTATATATAVTSHAAITKTESIDNHQPSITATTIPAANIQAPSEPQTTVNSASESITTASKTTSNTTTIADEQPPQFDAAYLNNPQPAYPLFAKKRQQQGQVMLKVRVSPEGKAEVVELAQSSGFSLLDDAAQQTVSKWRFVPARRDNTVISAWVIVPVLFKII